MIFVTAAIGIYLLWILFVFTMALERVRKAGKLTTTVKVLALPVVMFGFALDIFVNLFVVTILLLEWPQEKTTSERLKRINTDTSQPKWRKSVVRFVEPFLDPFDPSGDHV